MIIHDLKSNMIYISCTYFYKFPFSTDINIVWNNRVSKIISNHPANCVLTVFYEKNNYKLTVNNYTFIA